MSRRNPDDYEVGYGKPPEATRFKPGKSGNPEGRPKGARNQRTELTQELNQKIVVNEGGRRKRVTKRAALYKSLVTKGLQGDAKATQTILLLEARTTPSDIVADQPLDELELDLLRREGPAVIDRLKARSGRGDG